MPFIVRRDYVYLRHQHSYQTYCVYGGQQDIISQQAKALPSPASPCIHSTATNPDRV